MLALVGSGEYLPAVDSVDQALLRRLPSVPRVVCLPTAAGTEGIERIRYWSKLGVTHFRNFGVRVEAIPVIDRSSANNTEFAEKIASANFVYLSGGKPDYLFNTLEGSLVWKSIQTVLEGGGLLAGCSAGAMILGDKILGWRGGSGKAGFGFLPGVVVVPHYDEIPKALVTSLQRMMGRALTIIGIEANTALFRNNSDQFEVIGSGGVTLWNQSGKIRYSQGPFPHW